MMKKLYWFLDSQICIPLPVIMNACNLMIFVSKHEGSKNVIRRIIIIYQYLFDIGDVSEHLIELKIVR